MTTVTTVLVLLGGCGTPPTAVLPTHTPPAWRHAAAADGAAAPDLQRWWAALGDPALDALVAEALAQNLTVAQAGSRLRQARLLAGRDAAQFLPTLNGSVRPVQDAAAVDSYLHAGVDASWELGLFGLRQSTDDAAAARVQRAAADVQAARVALVAEVVRQHLAWRQALQQQAALQAQLALLGRSQALLAERQRMQLGTGEELRAMSRRRVQLQAQQTQPRQAAVAAAQALAALLARTAPDPAWQPAATLPPTLPLQVDALPADLLRWRPDIRAAEAEAARAAAELGMAQADLAPRIVLGAAYVRSQSITRNRRTVLSSVPSLGPFIDVPLFDWGRRKATADARDEALHAALLAYRQSVVDAVGEVETALSALALAQEQAGLLGQARALAVAQGQRQRTLAGFGLAAGAERLDAEHAALLAASDEAGARWAAAQALVTLYKALGGAPWDEAFAGLAVAGSTRSAP